MTRPHLMLLLLPIFGSNVPHQWIMFAKLLYLILVSLHYNSLITVNVIEIFVGIDDIPLLKVTFLYVSNYSDEHLFSCCACHRCISTDVLPVTWSYMRRPRLSVGWHVRQSVSA